MKIFKKCFPHLQHILKQNPSIHFSSKFMLWHLHDLILHTVPNQIMKLNILKCIKKDKKNKLKV